MLKSKKNKKKKPKNNNTEQDADSNGSDFFNREIQWLEFNDRVLYQAKDPRTPLLERLRFMSIYDSNLDEFVMKRVGGLKRQIDFGLSKRSHDGMTPPEQLHLIRKRIEELIKEVSSLYKDDILPELARHQIFLKKWKDLSSQERDEMRDYYRKNIFPVLTPLVVDKALPFPFISNLSLSLALKLQTQDTEEIMFGRVKIPEIFPQWLPVKSETGSYVFVSLLQVISHNLHDLFPDMNVLQVMPFRITRNADLEIDNEDAEDLLDLIAEEVKQRRFAEPVRLEIGKNSDPWMLELLKEELQLEDEDIYEVPGLLNYCSLTPIVELPLPHLKFSPWSPQVPSALADTQTPIFDLIKRNDILVHHPYESFSASVERYIRSAAEDPNVLAIKMTLYRTNEKSHIIKSLIKAAEQGKQVVCLVELQARFDEERNIYWAQQMEKVGIHVVYGVIGLKTHSKTALVLRKEAGEIQAYAHLSTGNYNSQTARLYTDVGLFTCKEEITRDVIQLFHFLTARSFKRTFETLLVAPVNMKQRFLDLIDREIANATKGRPAHIVAKFNSLEDKDIIRALYKASQAGVQVDLIVRGFSSLKPQVKGLSENIRVISIIGRFLEHSRIFYFQNGAERPVEGEFYMGSADWMTRNLHGRVEVITPIFDRQLKRRCWEILQTAMQDQRSCWELSAEGTYKLRKGQGADADVGSQEKLMKFAEIQASEFALESES